MEPVARLLETGAQVSVQVWERYHDKQVDIVSEQMARKVVANDDLVASPESITALMGDCVPEELFLPQRYSAASSRDAASISTSFSAMTTASTKNQDECSVMSLLKADESALRNALQQEPKLLPRPPSLSEVMVRANEDGEDDEDEDEDDE